MPRRRGVILASVLLLTTAVCGASDSDPDSARCDDPRPSFGNVSVVDGHREVGVRFTCAGVTLGGTAYLPLTGGPHAAVVWVFGNGPQTRLPFGPLTAAFVERGIAVFSFDKRGVGESGGECGPGDQGHFNLLAADAVGGVNAMRALADIDPKRVGLLGASQAGWIVPLAAARSSSVAFTALADAPTVSQGEESL